MVLQSRLEITVGERRFVIEEDDSFMFLSSEPHSYTNVFDARLLLHESNRASRRVTTQSPAWLNQAGELQLVVQLGIDTGRAG